ARRRRPPRSSARAIGWCAGLPAATRRAGTSAEVAVGGHEEPLEFPPREERSEVRITVLGKSPAWQDAGGACSGYLIEEDDYALLLDCGNGVFSKLRSVRDYIDI